MHCIALRTEQADPTATWLRATPLGVGTGVVQESLLAGGGSTVYVQIAVNASKLVTGTYSANVLFSFTHPSVSSPAALPVTLHVAGAFAFSFSTHAGNSTYLSVRENKPLKATVRMRSVPKPGTWTKLAFTEIFIGLPSGGADTISCELFARVARCVVLKSRWRVALVQDTG